MCLANGGIPVAMCNQGYLGMESGLRGPSGGEVENLLLEETEGPGMVWVEAELGRMARCSTSEPTDSGTNSRLSGVPVGLGRDHCTCRTFSSINQVAAATMQEGDKMGAGS